MLKKFIRVYEKVTIVSSLKKALTAVIPNKKIIKIHRQTGASGDEAPVSRLHSMHVWLAVCLQYISVCLRRIGQIILLQATLSTEPETIDALQVRLWLSNRMLSHSRVFDKAYRLDSENMNNFR